MSWLNFYGINIPEGYKQSAHFSKKFINWLEALEITPSAKRALQLKVDTLKLIRDQLLEATRHVRKLSQEELYENQVTLLRSIPGIGLINSMILLAEIGDVNRFKTLDKLASYVGLAPDVHSSGDMVIVKGVTHRCNHILRKALIESAWFAMRMDPALLLCYRKYVMRMHTNKAIIKIAKKLLSRIRYILINQVKYKTCIAQ